MGRPTACVAWSSVKLNMRVSAETFFLVERMALVHDLGCRKIGRGSEVEVRSSGSASILRDCSSREPIW